jgi:hypothetical protein
MSYDKMTSTELFAELTEKTKRLQRLEELKMPKPIIEMEQKQFNAVLNELMKYMSPSIIEKEMVERLQKKNHVAKKKQPTKKSTENKIEEKRVSPWTAFFL